MKLISKNKSDLVLLFLYIESILLSLIVENRGFFWFLFVLSTVTVFFYATLFLKIHWKNIRESEKKYDVLLVVLMTALLNANVSVFSNRLILGVIFLVFYIGLRFLMQMIKRDTLGQAKKNALNFSVLLSIFLGTNLLTNITIILEKNINGPAIPLSAGGLFGFIYLISNYNFLKNKVTQEWRRLYSLVLAMILTEASLLSGFYLERYPTIYKVESTTNMSIVTLPLFLVVLYYMLYGLIIHKLEGRLQSRVLMEYVGISVVILITLFITIRWFAV